MLQVPGTFRKSGWFELKVLQGPDVCCSTRGRWNQEPLIEVGVANDARASLTGGTGVSGW